MAMKYVLGIGSPKQDAALATVGAAKACSGTPRRALRGVIFDMDGTLTRPQAWMFAEMHSALHCPRDVDLLDCVSGLPSKEAPSGDAVEEYDPKEDLTFETPPASGPEAERRLRYVENKAMLRQEPTQGVLSALKELQAAGVQLGICTRNVGGPVAHFLENVVHLDPHSKSSDPTLAFEWGGPILTREFQPPKPSPKPLQHIINEFSTALGVSVDPREVIMVGDSMDDMLAGDSAGCGLVLVNHGEHGNDRVASQIAVDLVVKDLSTLVDCLRDGIEVREK